jgi:hypothetical protein
LVLLEIPTSWDSGSGVGVLCDGPWMDARRSYYLNSLKSDFADPTVVRSWSDIADTDIPYVIPANDNVPAKGWLSAISRTLFSRLIAFRFDI